MLIGLLVVGGLLLAILLGVVFLAVVFLAVVGKMIRVAHELRNPLHIIHGNLEGGWTACTRRTRFTIELPRGLG